jgi:hypothetical protein
MKNIDTFKWTENVSNGLSFRVPRIIVEECYWAALSSASKSVYVPLLKFVNKNGSAFPSIRTLAIVSGVTEKTAGHGIKGLEGLPGFKKIRKVSRRGHIAYNYFIEEPPPDNKHTIWMSHSYINGGNWSLLTPTAQAVLPVLKCFSYWEIERYCKEQGMEYSPADLTEIYRFREYDFVDADESIICEFAGVSKRSLAAAYKSLTDNYFIKPVELDGDKKLWELAIIPHYYYRRDSLNDRTKERYG